MKIYTLIFACSLMTTTVFSQVGIGTTSPSPASMLEVSSSTDGTNFKGFMPPRVPDIAARDLINAGYADYGLLIFVTDNRNGEGCLQMWDGESWDSIHCFQLASPVAWINEFHYDNEGTDTGEFIEIAGPAGMDLSTYSIVLYNGATGAPYNVVSLSGTIPNQSNGIGTHVEYINPIQNGSPDGIALVDSGAVLQFLSYEGDFTATDGPAAGMISTDIGFSEGSSTQIEHSLQLTGTGNQYNNFSWNPPAEDSPGQLNVGQIIN